MVSTSECDDSRRCQSGLVCAQSDYPPYNGESDGKENGQSNGNCGDIGILGAVQDESHLPLVESSGVWWSPLVFWPCLDWHSGSSCSQKKPGKKNKHGTACLTKPLYKLPFLTCK